MGHDDDKAWPNKPSSDDSWSFYTAQAQSMGQKALSSTDEAIKTARVQINHLQDASSHHFEAAQKFGNRAKQEYFHYEGLFFNKLKDGVHIAAQNPNATYAILGVTAIFALRTPRRLLYRHTIGRFHSEQALLARAETKVKEMRQTVDILRNETKKLEERAKLAEEELLRGRTKLKNTGSQLSSLSRSAYKTESSARGIMHNDIIGFFLGYSRYYVPRRNYSSSAVKGLQKAGRPEPQEEAKEMPGNWVVKGLVLAMLTYIGMNVAPMMGENMVRHSVSLVKVKDPFMKRSGASRLTMIATDDEKRKRIVDAGGVKALMGMLETASDDDTRREALTTLATLAHYDPAVDAMHKAGGLPLVNALSESAADSIIQEHCSALLAKLDQRAINKA